MLLELKNSNIDFKQVPIETVYIEENASTHFNPIKDSLKIYGVILSALVYNKCEDSLRILLATVVARVISSLFNFLFNRKAVFKANNNFGSAMMRYYVLCVCQLMVSYGLVYVITSLFGLGQVMTVVTKGVIDTILFMISFYIQRIWVFKK